MLGLTILGQESFTTVVGGAIKLWENEQQIVAVLVFFAAVLAPALQIGCVLVVLIGARLRRPPAWIGEVLRHFPFTRTWSMIEVMLLGILVALIKIAELARVEAGIGLYAMALLALLFPAMVVSFDARAVWPRVRWADAAAPGARAMR
jgi:paraquat-inducible protein A